MTTFFIAAGAVAFLMLGLSITLIRKGRPMQTDVGSNDNMKRLGLVCASEEIRRQEAALRGEEYVPGDGCSAGSCGTCATPVERSSVEDCSHKC